MMVFVGELLENADAVSSCGSVWFLPVHPSIGAVFQPGAYELLGVYPLCHARRR